jgi:hypothetical protein
MGASNARRRAHTRSVVSKADRTHNGVVYRSGFEAGIARDLDARGREFEYEAETLWYNEPRFSRVDWRIKTASGRTIYVESKGYFPPSDRRKVAGVVRDNPDVDYRLLFQNESDAKRHLAWLKKHRIKHAVGTIPDAWFNE